MHLAYLCRFALNAENVANELLRARALPTEDLAYPAPSEDHVLEIGTFLDPHLSRSANEVE